MISPVDSMITADSDKIPGRCVDVCAYVIPLSDKRGCRECSLSGPFSS